METRRKNNGLISGFTLVEVIVSIFIFSLVIASCLVSVGKGYELVDASRQNSRASQVLQSELELLRTLPWDTFKDQTNAQLTSKFQSEIATQFGSGVFTGTVSKTATAADLALVTVTVRWTGFRGRAYTASYFTYFTDGGINDYFITP